MNAYSHLCGWKNDGGHKAIAASLPRFEGVARHLVGVRRSGPTLLYKAWAQTLGKYPDYAAQEIGDCVSFGHGHGNDLLQCIEAQLGQPIDYRETDTEFIYGTSRQVAGLLGTSDGSYGAAAIQAMTTIGMVSREMLGADGSYSGDRAKAWGKTAPPHDLDGTAGAYKLGAGAQVTTWDELVAAIDNGYPVTICTNQGFTMTRDSDGFCAADGVWGHCMLIAGVRVDRPGACIIQSWGDGVPDGPTVLYQPSYSFWAERPVIESILAEGDSWALSKSPAFVVRAIPPSWKFHDLL